MGIKIIDDEPDVFITRREYDRLRREWERLTHMVNPPTLEEYIRNHRGAPAVTNVDPSIFEKPSLW